MSARAACLAMIIGAGIVTYGITANDLARVVGGGFVLLPAASLFTLAKVRAWTASGQGEKRRLERATRDAEDERTRYVAAQGAQMEEHWRRLRDLEAEKAALRAQLEAERARLHEEMQDFRDQLISDAMGATILMDLQRLLEPKPQTAAATVTNLFPAQPARERATAHPADSALEPQAARDREAGRP